MRCCRRCSRRRFGVLRGCIAASVLFGLWHVLPSLSLNEVNPVATDVFGTGAGGTIAAVTFAVVGTTVAGFWFCWIRYRARSVLATVLAHVALELDRLHDRLLRHPLRLSPNGRREPVASRRMDRPIGMFDSGFGGLTVARAVIDLLPAEDVVYIGDTGRFPYGPKPQSEVRGFAHELAWSLVKEFDVEGDDRRLQHRVRRSARRPARASCPCRSSTSSSPAREALVRATRSGRIGVIGTVGTIGSGAYDRAVAGDRRGRRSSTSAACPGFVEFVEQGHVDGRGDHDPRRATARAGQATPTSTRCCSAARTTRTSPA